MKGYYLFGKIYFYIFLNASLIQSVGRQWVWTLSSAAVCRSSDIRKKKEREDWTVLLLQHNRTSHGSPQICPMVQPITHSLICGRNRRPLLSGVKLSLCIWTGLSEPINIPHCLPDHSTHPFLSVLWLRWLCYVKTARASSARERA